MHNTDPASSIKERGLRLKHLRELIGQKRQAFAKNIGITRVTLSYWENASTAKGGLHEEGARKVINIADKAGVVCTLPWLLYGIGKEPHAVYASKTAIDGLLDSGFNLNKQKEIDLFLISSNLTAITTVSDCSMSPMFEAGDIVGGIWQPVEKIDVFDKAYIVEIEKGLQVRKIRKLNKNLYDVFSITYTTESKFPFEIKGVNLNRVVPIIRLWR